MSRWSNEAIADMMTLSKEAGDSVETTRAVNLANDHLVENPSDGAVRLTEQFFYRRDFPPLRMFFVINLAEATVEVGSVRRIP
jgi:hypothetical protein